MAHGRPDWSTLATSADAELPTYRYPLGVHYTGAGSTTCPVVLFNPANSTKKAKFRRFIVELAADITSDLSGVFIMDLERVSTLGNDSSGVAIKHDTNDANSALSIGVLPSSTPTPVSVVSYYSFPGERRTVPDVTRNTLHYFRFLAYQHEAAGHAKPLVLHPGQGVAFFIIRPAGGLYLNIDTEWSEEPE